MFLPPHRSFFFFFFYFAINSEMDGGTNKENEQTKAKITIYTHTVFHMGRSHKSADFPTATLHTNFLPNKVTVF